MTDRRKHRSLYRCVRCGHETRAYAPMERHVDSTHGGGRIEIRNENR